MNINWFPGHMAKAFRKIREHLPLVDVVVETSDARIPASSRNPELDEILSNRIPRILLLNKIDLADERISDMWISKFKTENIQAICGDARETSTAKRILDCAQELVDDKFKAREENNRGFKPLRIMIVGIPNTGKSTLINSISGRKAADTSNRPGVTRGPQWVKTRDKRVELLDMPGVLWPKLETPEEQFALAASGAIKDDLLPIEEVAYKLFVQLFYEYRKELLMRFKLENANLAVHIYDLYLEAAKKRGCIQSGGHIDETRFAKLLLTEFRAGKIGKISLENPNSKFNFVKALSVSNTREFEELFYGEDDDSNYGSK